MKPELRYFVLSYSIPNASGFRNSSRFGVAAQSIEDAIAVCRSVHPTATVWDASHHGIIHAIAPNCPLEPMEQS